METKTDKIKLRFDYDAYGRRTSKITDICERINDRVLPLAKELGVKLNIGNILRYARNSDELKADYIKQERSKMQVPDDYLINWVTETATKKYNELFNLHPYDDIFVDFDELLHYKGGKVDYDDKALKDLCTIYVREDQREVYERYLKAIDALNDFVRGKGNSFALPGLFTAVGGKFQASELINLDYFK